MGAPLVDLQGNLIGVTSVFLAQGTMSEITYAIPVQELKTVVGQILASGKVQRALLGIAVEDIQIEKQPAVVVAKVNPGSPADIAGVKLGDQIVTVAQKVIHTRMDLVTTLSSCRPNDTVEIEILREGVPVRIPVTLAPLPENQFNIPQN